MRQAPVILIVEDDAGLQHFYRTVLGFAGFTVRAAADGIQALRHIEAEPPDLVVLDLGLPGIDGVSVRQDLAARAESRQIPVVIVTGSEADLDHLKADCVLRKPVSSEDLIDTVRRCLATRRP